MKIDTSRLFYTGRECVVEERSTMVHPNLRPSVCGGISHGDCAKAIADGVGRCNSHPQTATQKCSHVFLDSWLSTLGRIEVCSVLSCVTHDQLSTVLKLSVVVSVPSALQRQRNP